MSEASDHTELYEAAVEADNRDYCAAAVALFEQFLSTHPDHAFARFRYAQNLLAIGRISDAERHLLLAQQQGTPPEKRWLLDLMYGEIKKNRGDFAAAEADFRLAADKRPDSTVPWIYLAGALAKQERFAEACDILRRALSADGDIDEVYLNLGNNLRALGDYAAARQCYVRAFEFTAEHYKEAEQALKDLDFLNAPDKKG
ncbi:MAG TPA: tetratricopeptide repeat protein [Candidatus Binatia bacterium]|nr:tetratricopeptide repeat protein [Candidatus Binatia bacterium]